MSESRRTITALETFDVTPEEIKTLLPSPHPLARIRRLAPWILYERYCTPHPKTIRQLASEYGVTFQRIEQIILESLDELANSQCDLLLPEDCRLRAAIIRRMQ